MKTNKHKENIFFNMISIYVILVIILTGITIFSCTVDKEYVNQIKIEPEDSLWQSILKFESKYVLKNEDPYYGYVIDIGYPMYLFSFGEMYYWMYKETSTEYYKNKFLSVISFILSIRNLDWTWDTCWGNEPDNLYNSLAASLFLQAYNITENISYLEFARNTINSFLNEDLIYFSGINNDKLYAFTIISEYLSVTKNLDPDLITAAKSFYDYAISQYNETSNKWYYDKKEHEANYYDGHSAYYQLCSIYLVLKRESAISTVFPSEYYFLESEFEEMLQEIMRYLTDNETFYYKIETPDYTESAADFLITLELYDRKYGTNHNEIKTNLQNIILQRQLDNGAYLRTNRLEDSYKIWYTDNIGKSLAYYVFLITG